MNISEAPGDWTGIEIFQIEKIERRHLEYSFGVKVGLVRCNGETPHNLDGWKVKLFYGVDGSIFRI